MEKGVETTEAKGVRLYDLLDCQSYTLRFLVMIQWIYNVGSLCSAFHHIFYSVVREFWREQL